MTAINVVIRMTLERDVWEEELFETIRNARGIRATAINPPLSRLLIFLRPIPAITKSSTSRQISLEDVINGEVPKMLIVSFTNVEQQTM